MEGQTHNEAHRGANLSGPDDPVRNAEGLGRGVTGRALIEEGWSRWTF